ncbi:glutamyl-tRNA amidotransferase [Actibacterium mucosum KCTC 23349]|uniref:Glutamyl-tRNA amidotransferase n=1 Tax=Actibacterium mucosum KCTC 23349 TaxID=1454373 RepID=A0A037ZIN9_9RHOB|nr:amidase [Actibacterium mucosum]KAJ54705.1 glutamyl-tRNA amidotransferase [Actibacterium mucosum KCTC 23349]
MSQNLDSLTDQIRDLAEGRQAPVSLAERALARVQSHAELNAFVAIDEEIVMTQAKAAQLRWQNGAPLSPIDGIPIAVKDNYLTRDYATTACSDAAPLEPAGVDATVVANLRAAGAVIFGKTNMHEWAYGATNTTSNVGVTKNPHNPAHITGGSSGGSGAAVAAGVVAAALGSDTGGSVRIPSAACGIYGFKPSYGRASRHGVLPLSWSLDAPGPMATELQDIVHLMPYFLGADPKDRSTAHAKPFGSLPDVGPLKLINLTGAGLERSAEVDGAVNAALRQSAAQVEQRTLQDIDRYFAAWEAILHCEASAYHQPLLQTRAEGFSPVTRAHLEAGTRLTGVELLTAQKLRGDLIRYLTTDLGDWDALVLPTLPVPAPAHGEDWQEFGNRRVTTQDSMTWFCWLGNLSGLPCVTLPIAKSSKGLPIGMMLMGRPGADEALLAAALRIDHTLKSKG